MKKITALLCCLTILTAVLCACTDNTSNSSVSTRDEAANVLNTYYNYETDCQFGITNRPFAQYITKGENGYYIFNEDDGCIYYTDVLSDTATPLCNKPNCMHNNYDCYAHIWLECDNIAYNNGYIYYVISDGTESGMNIMRMAVDGSGAQEVAYYSEDMIYEWIIHRDNLYIAYTEYESDNPNGDNDKCRLTIKQISLGNSGEATVIYDSEEFLINGAFHYLAAFDEYLYYSIRYTEDDVTVSSLNCYDMNNNATTEITLPDDANSEDIMYVYPLADKIVFKSWADVYECDLNGKNVKKIITLDEAYHNIFTDGTYMYEDNYANYINSDLLSITKEDSRILKVYDKDMNLVDTLDICDYEYNFCPCDDQYFISVNDDGTLSYFDKSQIGSINGNTWTENPLEILS